MMCGGPKQMQTPHPLTTRSAQDILHRERFLLPFNSARRSGRVLRTARAFTEYRTGNPARQRVEGRECPSCIAAIISRSLKP